MLGAKILGAGVDDDPVVFLGSATRQPQKQARAQNRNRYFFQHTPPSYVFFFHSIL
jgi:hypothetical protein